MAADPGCQLHKGHRRLPQETGQLRQGLQMAQLLHLGEHLPQGGVCPVQQIALPGPALLRRQQNAPGHVPHIHKIVAALHIGGELPLHVLDHHLQQVVPAPVPGTEDPCGQHQHRVQPLLRRGHHVPGGLGLGLGIAASDLVRVVIVDLPLDLPPRQLRQGVGGAHVDQPPDPALPAQVQDVSGPAHIHRPDLVADPARDGDDGRGVDDGGAAHPREQGLQGSGVPHVPVDILRPLHRRRLPRQQQGPDPVPSMQQLLQHRGPHMACGAGQNIAVHTSPFRK